MSLWRARQWAGNTGSAEGYHFPGLSCVSHTNSKSYENLVWELHKFCGSLKCPWSSCRLPGFDTATCTSLRWAPTLIRRTSASKPPITGTSTSGPCRSNGPSRGMPGSTNVRYPHNQCEVTPSTWTLWVSTLEKIKDTEGVVDIRSWY